MTLELSNEQSSKKKNIAVVIGASLLVVAVMVTAVIVYTQHRHQAEAQKVQDKTRQQAEQSVVTKKEAQYQADISRLVSICMESQARYLTLPAAQQAKETKPDCTLHVQ